ncbi:hypothetical protein [Chroococcidiopsis thermalis]|uniref:hypothetical protein n=1 Tax=Chroococcidiopsis thermalis TaxID=54299 RepID=UPI0015F0640D|nr:hypothetical protein [Chroococcidiopsis thermalis]
MKTITALLTALTVTIAAPTPPALADSIDRRIAAYYRDMYAVLTPMWDTTTNNQIRSNTHDAINYSRRPSRVVRQGVREKREATFQR